MSKAIVIVLDSVGIGAAPDAADYGDLGAATLQHTAAAVGGLRLPTLERLGLGCIPPLLTSGAIEGVAAVPDPLASFGAMRERSEGKDTITGHWELAGLEMRPGFAVFPPGPPAFPAAFLDAFTARTGRGVIGNRAASGTEIIAELGTAHLQSGDWIVYTSVDSVFQIAAHVDVVPLEELYAACRVARALCDPLRIGRVIARPFGGPPGAFVRTPDRRDYSMPPPEPTVLEHLRDAQVPVCAVGKIEDIYPRRSFSATRHTPDNAASQAAVMAFLAGMDHGLIMANFIDFDMLYGHRRDAVGYAACLEQADDFFSRLLPGLSSDDLLLVTADHGNDPTYPGTDHTRELVPVLVYRPGRAARSLGVRDGYYDVAQTLAAFFELPPLARGVAMLDEKP